MRADVMGCAGNTCIKTPNIDRLAMEGVRFKNAFTSFPLCSPFRASLFTGKYAHSNGQFANHYPIPLGQDFLAEILRDNGYRTGYIGKWHLDGGIKPGFVPPGERRLGFDHFVGFNRGHFYFNSIYYRDTDQPYHCPRYEPDYQTDHLIEFMESCVHAPDGNPFLAMICLGIPHPPLVAPPYYRNLYSPEEVSPRSNVPLDPESQERARNFLAGYYGLVANVDHNIGRILDWLDKKGLADDTLVVLLSDHGEMAGEQGCYGKKTAYDSSMRVPLIVRYPRRFPAGHTVSSLVDVSVDTMPTLLELCELPILGAVQGTSYLSLLDGGSEPTRNEVYYEIIMEGEGPERFPVPERGVRTVDWLYVRTEDSPKVLFDLRNDPLEMSNLIGDSKYSDTVRELDSLLREHMARTDDDWSIEAKFPPPNFMTHQEGAENVKRLLEKAIVEQVR
jgi:arylsulfatase A-like enzyme